MGYNYSFSLSGGGEMKQTLCHQNLNRLLGTEPNQPAAGCSSGTRAAETYDAKGRKDRHDGYAVHDGAQAGR